MVLRAVLAAIVGTAVMLAVVSMPVGEVSKEANHARREVSLTPPPGANFGLVQSVLDFKDSYIPETGLKETGQPLYNGGQPPRVPEWLNGDLSKSGCEYALRACSAHLPVSSNLTPRGQYFLPEHDPMWAAILDPGFVIPRPAPAPQAQVTAAALSEGEARAILTEAGWPLELHDQALAVAFCESRHRPDAVGDGGNSLGWFQLWYGWFSKAGFDRADYADPLVNASVARYVYEVRGRWGGGGGWSCAALVGVY